ncbi:hypothetical protein [Acetivibrio straminisolvens]|uniref:Uncharacterized protein n=1 Tax=Acetivibrio straminisolvens JCM 21531 TaxID=1294263 RepID=W4V1U8_9FIRM|nr:hypothetical protein [Acetivibrio straminisolvens]GAE87087.1 hypothetical protein JCM21531_432 [Acetivibrio straminisolvens JCM 21531]
MEEVYNQILFSEFLFGIFAFVIGLIVALVLWFYGDDVIKVKRNGVVVREIKLKKSAMFVFKRLLPLIILLAVTITGIYSTLDYVKKDYLYGEGTMTYYRKASNTVRIEIDNKYYSLPRTYRKNFSSKNIGTTYKFVYAKRTKLILHIEAVEDRID